MPKGIYKHKKHSEKTKEKMRQSAKNSEAETIIFVELNNLIKKK